MKASDKDPVMEDLARNLTKLYDDHQPDVSYRDIERALIPILGPTVQTAETIRQYHLGNVSRARADVMLVAAICGFYDERVADVSSYFAERAEEYREVLSRIACYEVNAGRELSGVAA